LATGVLRWVNFLMRLNNALPEKAHWMIKNKNFAGWISRWSKYDWSLAKRRWWRLQFDLTSDSVRVAVNRINRNNPNVQI
jgi:hypothetical protein